MSYTSDTNEDGDATIQDATKGKAKPKAKSKSRTAVQLANKSNLKPHSTSRLAVLFDMEPSAEAFLKQDFATQKEFSVSTKSRDHRERGMPRNEVSVMALNELCSRNLRGFFMWLPSSSSLSGEKKNALETVAMKANSTGPAYPAMMFIDFVWTIADRKRFDETPHSTKYLQSSFRFSPPRPETPVYPITFSSHWNMPVSVTNTRDRMALIEGADIYYCGAIAEFVKTMGVKKNGSKTTTPTTRIHLQKALFEEEAASSPEITRFKTSPLGCGALEAVYHKVLQCCTGLSATLHSTTYARDIPAETYVPNLLPATGLGESSQTALKSRRGIKRKRVGGTSLRLEGAMEDDEDEEDFPAEGDVVQDDECEDTRPAKRSVHQ